jgi:murein DD-endopeptidase MepM/ murein hydrolase activator NlpD
MKFKENKVAKVMKGKGFYAVVAGCLLATGVAAWTAFDGFSAPESPEKDPSSSNIISSDQVSSDTVSKEETDQPYYPEEEEVPIEEETQPKENLVAENFVYPLTGNVVKHFSDRDLVFSETFGDMRVHNGADIAAKRGTAVYSCGNGIVVATIHDDILGNYVEIDHGNGIVARYCGLSENFSVKEGNIVSAGTKLGLLDIIPSEKLDEIHLHLEFYKDEIPVDPCVIIEG